MKLSFMFLFNLLLLNCCLSANIDGHTSHGEVQQQNENGNGSKTSAFNEDFEYAMFDNSDLDEILQFAKDSRVSDFVRKHIFPVKYQNYDYRLLANNNDDDQVQNSVSTHEKCFYFVAHNFFLEIIKYFGESIQKLTVYNTGTLTDERLTKIYQYVNEYCSESMTSLYLGYIKEHILRQFENPFPRLQNLTCMVKAHQARSMMLFSKIFPNLERITVKFYNSTVENQINGNRPDDGEMQHMEHMKHLKYIDIEVCGGNSTNMMMIESQLENMFEQNPQIQSLSYTSKLSNFMQVINEKLPNLEHFTMRYLDSEVQALELNNVKRLSVYSYPTGPIERLSFPKLEILDMFYSLENEGKDLREFWTPFFKNHQHLKTLNCQFYDDEGFVELLAELPNLHKIQILNYHRVEFDLINRIIADRKSLMKFQYDFSINLNDLDMTIYREKFQNQWHITIIRTNLATLLFERIN